MYKHFIWDFDGTLFDTYPMMISMHEQILLEHGVTGDKDLMLKIMKEQSSKELIEYYTKKYNISKKEYIESYEKKSYMDEYINSANQFENVSDVCKYIVDKGYKNYIISHKNESIMKFLDKDDMSNYFEDIIIPNMGFKHKPDTEMFEYLINKYNMGKDEVLSIGDRNIDLVAASKIGIDTCLYKPYSEKLDYKPRYIINSMDELYGVIL